MTAALDALDAAVATISALDVDRCGPVTRLRALERLETARRRPGRHCRDYRPRGLLPKDPQRILDGETWKSAAEGW